MTNTMDKGSYANDRERVLAAIGWEEDPRRSRVLRELLEPHLERIYLHAYALGLGRGGAMQRARVALLDAARTLEDFPDGCSLPVWVFLALRKERMTECAETWRVLVEAGPGDASEEAWEDVAEVHTAVEADEGSTIARHLDIHPHCRELLDEYRTYLVRPSDSELRARSGSERAVLDLRHFLEGQFGDRPGTARGIGSWRRFLPSTRALRSRTMAIGVVLAALLLVSFLWRAWDFGGKLGLPSIGRDVSELRSGGPSDTPPIVAEPTPEPITGARVELAEQALIFQWDQVAEVQEYDLLVLTARLDTLRRSGALTGNGVRLAAEQIPGLESGGSYLFRVDGLRNGRRVASTGYKPFEIP